MMMLVYAVSLPKQLNWWKTNMNIKLKISNILPHRVFYNAEDEPVRCKYCWCDKMSNNVELESGDISVIQIHCKRCNELLGYWTYD